MNKKETAHFRMQLSVQDYLDQKPDKWDNIPKLVTFKNNLDETISRAQEKDTEAVSGPLGVTERKNGLKKAIARKAANLSGVVQSLAHEIGDMDLLKKVSIARSDIEKGTETDVEGIVMKVVGEARDRLEALAEYGILEEALTEIETSVHEFNSLIGRPRVIRNNNFVSIGTTSGLIDAGNDILKNHIDNLMLRFQESDPEFYDGYRRARTIVDM